MTRIKGVRRYLRLPRSVQAQAREDVETEIRFHLEMRTEELVSTGLAPHQAREMAEDEFGDLDSAVEYCRRQSKRREQRVRGMEWLKSSLEDCRFAIRMLVRNRGFTAVVLATIALGIGANTAIFSVVNAVLLRPFPFEEPDRLVTLWESNPGENLTYMTVAPPNFADWRAACESIETMAAWSSRTFFLDQGEGPIQIQGARVTIGLFETLRSTPLMGRTITPEEDLEGADPVVILSYGFWNGRLGADPAVLGSVLLLDEVPHRVIGVMPSGFSFPPQISLEGPAPPESEVWVPLGMNEGSGSRGQHFLHVIGRLADGATLDQARSELVVLAGQLEEAFPESNTGWTAAIVPLDEKVFGDLQTPLTLLLAAVGFVLLIACVNVANLLLARGATRQREFATRASLGAGQARLTRQLLAESMFLALMGGAAGLLLATVAVEVLVAIAPQSIPRLHETSVDITVAVFTLLISIVTGILFGLAPAWQGRRVNLIEQMREGGARTGSGGRTARFRSALIVAEVALSLVLLFGAGLML
ncbi:ABC transporter permease, partial [Candidatus Zixiibacteriota bacterium]